MNASEKAMASGRERGFSRRDRSRLPIQPWHRRCGLVFPLAVVTALLPGGCRKENGELVKETREWPVMGTRCALTVERPRGSSATDACEADVKETMAKLEDTLSVFKPESEICRLNRNAGAGPVPVSKTTAEILRISANYAARTGGCFDPTVAPLVNAWGFGPAPTPRSALSADALREPLARIGYAGLIVSEDSASLSRSGMSVTLGGIAKGYAVDVAWTRLVSKGIRNVMVDLGGNLRCGGADARASPWKIGVRHPFDKRALAGVLTLSNGLAVATSGNYENFVVLDGRRYAHILDPRDGMPVEGMAQVTVVSTNAVETDALSTGLFVMKLDAGFKLLGRMPGCEALFVPDTRPIELHVTPGFMRRFVPDPALKDRVIVHSIERCDGIRS